MGTGVLTMPVYRTLPHAEITCLDYSADMMEQARRRTAGAGLSNVRFQQGDVGALPFMDNSFDLVLSLNGFHAFPDKEAAYRETLRVLKPGGVFCGGFCAAERPAELIRWVQRFYVRRGFLHRLRDGRHLESVSARSMRSLQCTR